MVHVGIRPAAVASRPYDPSCTIRAPYSPINARTPTRRMDRTRGMTRARRNRDRTNLRARHLTFLADTHLNEN